eukprot:g60367.t1
MWAKKLPGTVALASLLSLPAPPVLSSALRRVWARGYLGTVSSRGCSCAQFSSLPDSHSQGSVEALVPSWVERGGAQQTSRQIAIAPKEASKLNTADTVTLFPEYPHEHVMNIQAVVDFVHAKKLYDVEVFEVNYGPKYWVVCTAPSSRAAYSYGHQLSKIAKQSRSRSRINIEGSRRDDWFIVDLLFCWVHIFVQDKRAEQWPYISHHCPETSRIPFDASGKLQFKPLT